MKQKGGIFGIENMGILKPKLTPLMKAASENNVNEVNRLIGENAQVVDEQDKNGKTALMYAAENGSFECLSILINVSGNKINQQDKNGKTALMYAAENGRKECIGLLIASGANFDRAIYNSLFIMDQKAFENLLLLSPDFLPLLDEAKREEIQLSLEVLRRRISDKYKDKFASFNGEYFPKGRNGVYSSSREFPRGLVEVLQDKYYWKNFMAHNPNQPINDDYYIYFNESKGERDELKEKLLSRQSREKQNNQDYYAKTGRTIYAGKSRKQVKSSKRKTIKKRENKKNKTRKIKRKSNK